MSSSAKLLILLSGSSGAGYSSEAQTARPRLGLTERTTSSKKYKKANDPSTRTHPLVPATATILYQFNCQPNELPFFAFFAFLKPFFAGKSACGLRSTCFVIILEFSLARIAKKTKTKTRMTHSVKYSKAMKVVSLFWGNICFL